jgi:hypothetical protein
VAWHHAFAFWVSVGLVAIGAVALFKVLFLRFSVPGLTTLAGSI